ncbi:CHAT domain-containing protein [Saccharothrix sp. HUAS TT1]|uniref:CHAT domain-containing protein n=1 Tax=unclassified Saccharothrix TaxID=2593673 RepID=UPI00345C1643
MFTETLAWLWDGVVSPVLNAVPGRDPDRPTRLWWLPMGLIGSLPLHAAGHPGRPGALDHCVSSYVPTLRALAHARNRPTAGERRQLVVALEHTPGLGDLPGTTAESEALHTARPDLPLLDDNRATTEAVLTHLGRSTWCHFACHAVQDARSPSRSALALHDRPLTAARISRLRMESAELAYLSACSTAYSGPQLPDESIHLSSAFHLAGFKHVIAGLWPLGDSFAAVAAKRFYLGLPDSPDAGRAAYVLNAVVRELRDEQPARPDLWASLVHSGP